jgi:hypothetical protein
VLVAAQPHAVTSVAIMTEGTDSSRPAIKVNLKVHLMDEQLQRRASMLP